MHYTLISCFVYDWSHYCHTQEAWINFESQGEDKVDWKRVPLPTEHPPLQSEACQPQYNLISSYPISKELDSLVEATRDIHTMMQRLHNPECAKENTVLTRNKFKVLKNIYKKLESQLDPRFAGNYSKLWSKAASCAVYLAMMMVYLDSNALATKQQVEEMHGWYCANVIF